MALGVCHGLGLEVMALALMVLALLTSLIKRVLKQQFSLVNIRITTLL